MTANYVQYCPRCATENSTFDIYAQNSRGIVTVNWVERFEIFAVCRVCKKVLIFLIDNKEYSMCDHWGESGIVNMIGVVNQFFKYQGYINLSDLDVDQPPDHMPGPIAG